MLLHELFEESSRRFADRPAVVQGEAGVAYRDLAARVNGLARHLRANGIRRGERVLLLLENSAEYVASYFGVMKAGAIAVPLGAHVSERRLKKVIGDCSPAGAICRRNDASALAQAAAGNPPIRVVVGVDSLGEIPGGGGNPGGGLVSVDESDVALILYTSGTTGDPKGVMLTHRNLVANAESIVKYLGLTADDKVMAVLPFHYAYGNSLLTTHMLVGGSLVVENSFVYPNVILDRMEKDKVTGFSGVPSTFSILLRRSNIKRRNFPSLRYVTQAGAAMPPKLARELADALPAAKIFVMYGQTEATARLSYLDPSDLFRKAGSIGKAIPGVTLTVKRDDGRQAAFGEVGELVARGDNIMAGYWNRPEETAQVLKEDGLHTGDMAWMDGEGYFFICGRASEMIKSGAHRIGPKEVENVLCELDGVAEAAVVGMPDDILGEAVKACIVKSEGSGITHGDVLRHCAARMEAYMVPKKVEFLEELPRTPAGKVDKGALTATGNGVITAPRPVCR